MLLFWRTVLHAKLALLTDSCYEQRAHDANVTSESAALWKNSSYLRATQHRVTRGTHMDVKAVRPVMGWGMGPERDDCDKFLRGGGIMDGGARYILGNSQRHMCAARGLIIRTWRSMAASEEL